MALTSIPHCGQLNITNSTLPRYWPSVLKEIVVLVLITLIVSSWLAHMFPSSPVSVGILPSNRTLVVGVLHLDRVPSPMPVVTSEHCPTADDPFTDTVSAVGKM
jgi:hypothetical protein